jgi:hypothetical protein
MGNILTKDSDTIHWNSNKNDNLQLTNDSKLLLDRLSLPDKLEDSETKSNLHVTAPHNPSIPQIGGNNQELSDTSPFISSDM